MIAFMVVGLSGQGSSRLACISARPGFDPSSPIRTPPRAAAQAPAWGWHGGERPAAQGWVAGGVHVSFLPAHPTAIPAIFARFVAAAACPGVDRRLSPFFAAVATVE